MIAVIGIASIVAFAVAFACFGIIPIARQAISTSLTGLGAIRDPGLDDAVRERLVRSASLSMIGNFASIFVRGVGVFAVSSLPIVFADQIKFAPTGEVVEFLSRWDVIIGASAVVGGGWLIKKRAWPCK